MTEPDIKKFRDKYIGKLTIKEPYSRTKFLSVRIRGYIDLFRAFTLIAPFIVAMSMMVASIVLKINNGETVDSNWWITVIYASGTIAIVNAASNALNQATDFEADKISKPYRPIPRNVVRPDEAQSLAYLLYLFALLRSATIKPWFGFFIFLIMIFTITYSLPPRMKKYLFINQIWIAIPRGMLGILAAWSVFGDPFTPTPLIIGAIATTYLIGGMATKDILDSVADKRTGTHTLINTYGIKKTALICFPFMFFPFAFIPIFINRGLLANYLWPLSFLVIVIFLIMYYMIKTTESKTLENTYAWLSVHILYIIFAMGFSLLTIFNKVLPF
jgi:geranylgeranylglycerol-phosphate geranylgeranyltransferase